MAFEAYHTANRRLHGLPVDEFSSLIPLRSPQAGSVAGPIALMLLGVLFLIMTTRPEWLREVFRWWPVALIAGGSLHAGGASEDAHRAGAFSAGGFP